MDTVANPAAQAKLDCPPSDSLSPGNPFAEDDDEAVKASDKPPTAPEVTPTSPSSEPLKKPLDKAGSSPSGILEEFQV